MDIPDCKIVNGFVGKNDVKREVCRDAGDEIGVEN